MGKRRFFVFCFLLFVLAANAQKDTVQLGEIVVNSNRINLPFSKSSRTIVLLTHEEILKSSANNMADLLQSIPGIDVRRRGVEGMQSDLYIRGGNFDQSLVLIDGIKMDDPQTGHHSMNAIIPLENIERIEIIKGPAARIFGQNAFTGAVNIITKKLVKSGLDLATTFGTHNTMQSTASFGTKKILASITRQSSDGYRFNTDFENIGGFFKSQLGAITLISTYSNRKFGANGFYASPEYKDQYEETQTSLISLSSRHIAGDISLKPRVYWRRNQDMYLFLRQDPSYYRNMHISNKYGGELNTEIVSTAGRTGLGVELSYIELNSNNLGNHHRTALTGFVEHRLSLFDGNVDITPGTAISHYSDFGTTMFPGVDVGVVLNEKFKLYGNIGKTYRVPTFTDLYYVGPTTMGNSDLEPESAFSQEFGLNFNSAKLTAHLALFKRRSDDLIDWTKDRLEDKWQTQNFSEVITRGLETAFSFPFRLGAQTQQLKISYSYIDDEIKDQQVTFTRYSLNSLKHQLGTSINFSLTSLLKGTVSYRYVERTDGEKHKLFDGELRYMLSSSWNVTLAARNIFNEEYSETNGVIMPKGTVSLGIRYKVF